MALDPDVVVVAPLELITADHLNDIRANLVRLDTEFDTTVTTWTPTVTGVTKGTGHSETALYTRHGPVVHCIYSLTLGTGAAVTGDIQVSLPVTASYSLGAVGVINDADVGLLEAVPLLSSSTVATLRAIYTADPYSKYAAISATVPHTWATGDSMFFGLSYLAA